MKYEMSEQQVKNLLLFLDRVEVKGITEVKAFTEILILLQNPIKEKLEVKKGE